MESSTAGGWYPDPIARFELRYHNGSDWTADVSSNGQRFVDPLGVQPGPNAHSGTGARNGAATAALVLGIVGIGLGWLPFVVVLGAVAALLAIVFGFVGRRRSNVTGTGRGFAIAALVMGPIGLLVCIVGVVFTITFVDAIDAYDNPAASQAEIVGCESDGTNRTANFTITNVDDVSASYTVRIDFVRDGTDNVQREALVAVDEIAPGETARHSVSRRIEIDDVGCVIRAVHGPLPFGVDPGA